MSISDEDTASTTSKRSTKSPPRKIRHREVNDINNTPATNSGNATKSGSDSAALYKTVPLTTEQVVEYARVQVERVLQCAGGGDENSNIAVIPSLVSLSTDFFTFQDGVGASDGGVASTSGATSLDFPSSFPTLTTSGGGSAFAPSLRPRQHNNVDSSSGVNGGNVLYSAIEQQLQNERSVTPPIGPQGAPIPRHILSRLANQNPTVDAASSATTGSESVARGSNNINASPSPRQIFTTNYQNTSIQLSAPARLGQSILHPSNQATVTSRNHDSKYINVVQSLVGAVERMERRLEQGENAAINTITSATNNASFGQSPHVSSRLAPSTPQRNNATSFTSTPVPSTPKQAIYKDNIDELESSTITQLAEIMLHPPVAKVVVKIGDEDEKIVRYVWKEDGEDEMEDVQMTSNEKTDLDSPMEGNDDAVQTMNSSFDATIPNIHQSAKSKPRYQTSQAAHASIANLGLSMPRRVCQHPFRKNDIVWVCRTCQSDETCVLCHDCFTHSNHEGHDVAFYHAQAGGCCDCGDADAWDPKGFCSKHGTAKGAPAGSAVAIVEPSVLGGVYACGNWLVEVVRDGVEGAYRRANPALFSDSTSSSDERNVMNRSESSSASCDRQDGIDTRQRMETRRQQSFSRRNTVADVETMNDAQAPMQVGDDVSELDSSQSSNVMHEAQFNPSAASSSKKWLDSKPEALSDSNDTSEVFDPEVAGSRVAKKARAPPDQSPAWTLGDLGREEHGLFLILHADDIYTGAHQPTEAIEALKELYSSPAGGRPDVANTSSASVSSSIHDFSPNVNFGPFPRLAPRLGRDTNRFLFRAPQADAIINKILRLVQKHGNCVVWGTQEIIAECGDVISKTWLDGDPESSKMIGAAMLNRAKILKDRGLVCSIKTHRNLSNDQKATAVIRLISSLAESCDSLCDQVSSGISGRGITPTLNAIIRSDLKLPCKVTTSWHALLLTLLAQPEFKASLAVAYCETYRAVAKEYARGVGVVERSSFTLSVQFLNRTTYVEALVRDRNLLSKLSQSLLETISTASFIPGAPGAPTPAGASPDTIVQLSSLRTERSNLSAVLMALFGSFSFDQNDQFVLMELDSELDNLMYDFGGNVTGGDSRYHGRIRNSIPRIAENSTEETSSSQITLDSLIKRTQALVNPTLNPTHPYLQNRRYSPCISDLKCVLNVKGMARMFLSLPRVSDDSSIPTNNKNSAFDNWIKTLTLGQSMDAQMWRAFNLGHIESEHRGWVGAFNTSISLGSVFERLLNWDDSDPCILGDQKSIKLLSCAEVAHYALTTGVHRWQRSEMLSYRSTPHPSSINNAPPHVLCPASLPFSTVASFHGTNLAMAALPLSQIQMWSFHLPLHRFAAACIREVSRRPESGGIDDLLRMFEVPGNNNESKASSKSRQMVLLFRGMMEFPLIVLSRAAQIRAGIWRRNGPGMTDQVLNYSEPPYCRNLHDSDLLMVQFSLICQALFQSNDVAGLMIGRTSGTSSFVNLLLHRYGVFDFLGFRNAPSSDVDGYAKEIRAGFYPREIVAQSSRAQIESTLSNALPWTYSPARDFAMFIALVEEFLMIIILVITEMPSPPARNETERVSEARQRLKREVIHRLASGPKTHSEMAEVHHVLSQRDNLILCDEGKHINPDDASGAALESVLNDVAIRKTRIGDADQWELRKSSWAEYDPAFGHIGTRAHQAATESRPKQQSADRPPPYAPKPPPAHGSFNRLRKDLTADSVVLSIVYRVIHAYCHDRNSTKSVAGLRGKEMYESGTKSEASLARAIHILTLGSFAWQDNLASGGTDVGSVFHGSATNPGSKDWVDMAMLRQPTEVMKDSWYEDEEILLLLIKKVATDTLANDQALRSGAAWLCDFAAECNPVAADLLGRGAADTSNDGGSGGKNTDLEKRKALAKARQQQAIEKMKLQMAKFAQAVGEEEASDDETSVQEPSTSPHRDRSESFEQPTFSTPLRVRTESDANSSVHAMDLGSPGDFILTTPPMPSYPTTPRTPCSSGTVTPKNISYHAVNRLLSKRPQCIICGGSDSITQMNQQTDDKSLALCAFAQPSTVAKGGGGSVLGDGLSDNPMRRHVGVFVSLCGHAVHSSCCDSYLKTSVHRDDRYIDRLEGGKKKEFRCPLCQRLSNSLVPFIDVGVDWVDTPERGMTDAKTDDNSTVLGDAPCSLHKFLSSTRWWSRNERSMLWDGHCSFSTDACEGDTKPSLPHVTAPTLTMKSHVFGKKDLISAWNRVLKTPRIGQRSARSSTPNRASDSDLSFPNLESDRQKIANVWRRFMDTVSDSALTTDTKRLGEDVLVKDYGEFRHYMSEKAFYNKLNAAAGKELVDWPACISTATLSESRRQELSKEKLLSKLMFTIQSFTYSCCCEAAEARREYLNATAKNPSQSDFSALLAQFGLERALMQGNLLLFPKAVSSADEGSQPFDGRIGKLRHLGLALMISASPLSSEIIQLSMSFPSSHAPTKDPFEFDERESEKKRAPVAYPILRGHILTHTTCSLIAATGKARTEDEGWDIDSTADECRHLTSLGLIARIAQSLLSELVLTISNVNDWKRKMKSVLEQMLTQKAVCDDEFDNEWIMSCLSLLRLFVGDVEGCDGAKSQEYDSLAQATVQTIELVKTRAIEFLRDISIIQQILVPNMFANCNIDERVQSTPNSIMKSLMALYDIHSLPLLLKSHLVEELLKSWFKDATESSATHLETPGNKFPGITWPQSSIAYNHDIDSNQSDVLVPLLGCCGLQRDNSESICCIVGLPKSYTDLYAELVILCPDCEQVALCLVCGEVLNASGKGECSRHAFRCGGGAGIFFLLQECVSLMIHGVKAAYTHSPYVDSHGETPQYRGRPLNLDEGRYEILRKLWSGHKLREKVVSERGTTRQVIIPNFY